MALQVEVPTLGESVTQAVLIRWHKQDGEYVQADEPVCELETDKANADVPAPKAGILKRLASEGDTVKVGQSIASIEEGDAPAASTPAAAKASPSNSISQAAPLPEPAKPLSSVPAEQSWQASPPSFGAATAIPRVAASPAPTPAPAVSVALEDFSPAVRRLIEQHNIDPAGLTGTGPGGRITPEDITAYVEEHADNGNAPAATKPAQSAPAKVRQADSAAPAPKAPQMDFDANGLRRMPMSRIRKRIAERLVSAQQTAAILTTFNEIDMQAVMDLRARYKERFAEVHNISLGFMSFFVKACAVALKEFPRLNAFIEGEDILYHENINMGIAVSTDRGLAVPVLRAAETMGFARIESEIKRLANATRDGKLSLQELSGGTFTITNGGVFGSLLSTPIINPPQSGILGMHAIQKRPVVINDKIEIRPMMYVALSYDHRLVDGRESVSFLVRLKQLVEDPARLMLEV